MFICHRSRWFLETARQHGFKGTIAGTRKTTPGKLNIVYNVLLIYSMVLNLRIQVGRKVCNDCWWHRRSQK